jgi:uncharacterized protein DUF1275
VIALTAVAMGLRDATMRRLTIPDLTPTMMTLTLTGLAADSSIAGGANPWIRRRVASVLLLIAGAAIGALLLARSPPQSSISLSRRQRRLSDRVNDGRLSDARIEVRSCEWDICSFSARTPASRRTPARSAGTPLLV